MKPHSTLLRALLLTVPGMLFAANSDPVPTPLPLLRVSENKRFLVQADGRPFFWLGDTAWELLHRLTRDEAEHYLRKRAQQGFNVIQAVVLAELDGLSTPNAYGHLPLHNHDPLQPVEEYFRHVDWVVNKAASLGLYIGMLPSWGDKWNKKSWGAGPEIFTAENARGYGEWLGRRFAGQNIIWILGGDRPIETEVHKEIIRAMAQGLRRGDAGRHLITMHPGGGRGSSEWFHADEAVDFNMRQSGHVVEYSERYVKMRLDYNLTPVKPVIDGESIYEDHPISFKAPMLSHSTAADVRRPFYWNIFNGAFGHTYGHHSVWQMWTAQREPVNAPLLPWRDAIDQPGAGQMQHGRRLIESRPFLTRIPDDDIIVPGPVPTAVPGAGRYRFVATRDSGGSYAMIYVPVGRMFRVRLTKLSGSRVTAWWFNPRTGEATSAGEFANNKGERDFISPTRGETLDWVLVLDDASKKFPPPGVPLVGHQRS